jgi:hypothetical protein
VHALVFKNPFVEHCLISEFARELFKPVVEKIDESTECGTNQVFHIANVTDYCKLGCKTGCYCKPGYLKYKDKGCVSAEEAGSEFKNFNFLYFVIF